MIAWQWYTFNELTTDLLYRAMTLRQRVFAVEQNCAYLDADGFDRQSHHLLGMNEAGDLIAYLRLVQPGYKYEELSIGRVISAPEVRGQGVGRELMRTGIAGVERMFPGQPVRISAQAHLQKFYEECGFHAVSGLYLEDGIPHIEMLWVPVHGERIPGMFQLGAS